MSGVPLSITFVGGGTGPWRVDRMRAVRGEGLPSAERLSVLEGRDAPVPPGSVWTLRGVTSNERYVTRTEHDALADRQPALGRPGATRAALIPVRKSPEGGDPGQDGRRV